MKRAFALILCLGLPGCQELGIGKGEVGSALGAGFGGYGGGWLGSQVGSGAGQTVATIAGVSMGALFGSAIGRKLAEGDLNLIGQATQQTLETSPSGSATAWRNPDTGRAGSVVAGPAYQQEDRPCRPFEQTLTIDGQLERAKGVACRRSDGTWDVQPG
jgi:surface antigen